MFFIALMMQVSLGITTYFFYHVKNHNKNARHSARRFPILNKPEHFFQVVVIAAADLQIFDQPGLQRINPAMDA